MFALRLKSSWCHKLVQACSQNVCLNISVPSRSVCTFYIKRNISSSSFTTLDSSDIELAYAEYPQETESLNASKTPLIFMHGLFGAKGNLHSVAKHLASDGRKIITFDARNHGDSQHCEKLDYQCMSDDLQDLTQQLQLDQPLVLGHSMGGKTAMVTALTQPDALSTLIVADITPNQRVTSETNNLKVFAQAMKDAKIPQDQDLSHARKTVQVQLGTVIENRGILSFLLTNLREFPDGSIKWRVNLDAILNNFASIASFPDLSGKSFSKPTLFVFGGDSHHYKNLDLGLVKQLFTSVEVESIPGAGHFVHADKPLEFVAVIQEFLKTAEKR